MAQLPITQVGRRSQPESLTALIQGGGTEIQGGMPGEQPPEGLTAMASPEAATGVGDFGDTGRVSSGGFQPFIHSASTAAARPSLTLDYNPPPDAGQDPNAFLASAAQMIELGIDPSMLQGGPEGQPGQVILQRGGEPGGQTFHPFYRPAGAPTSGYRSYLGTGGEGSGAAPDASSLPESSGASFPQGPPGATSIRVGQGLVNTGVMEAGRGSAGGIIGNVAGSLIGGMTPIPGGSFLGSQAGGHLGAKTQTNLALSQAGFGFLGPAQQVDPFGGFASSATLGQGGISPEAAAAGSDAMSGAGPMGGFGGDFGDFGGGGGFGEAF